MNNRMFFSRTAALVVYGCLLVMSAAADNPASAEPARLTVASRDGEGVRIITSSSDPLAQRTVQWCRKYLDERGMRLCGPRDSPATGPLWILETQDRRPKARSLGVDLSFLDTAKHDAFVLSILPHGKSACVSIVGRNVMGMRSGVVRLIALLQDSGKTLTAPAGRVARSPFFAIRELTVANTGKLLRGTQYADTLWRRWSDERIRRYVEQIWLMGFNSLQTIEGRSFPLSEADPAQLAWIVHKTRVLMRAARDYGMLVTQWVWVQGPYGRRMCWNTPHDRQIMMSEYAWLAKTYARYADHILIYPRDPGGCSLWDFCPYCDDYRTPQQIAKVVRADYLKVNPRLTFSLSAWYNWHFWDGMDEAGFLDDRYMPKDIAIALRKWYRPDEARRTHEAGREVDIWSWYTSDNETTVDMSLAMRRLDAYFSGLPVEASGEVRRLSTEICYQGWPQVINAYVSAQKMWNPYRRLKDIEREFCSAMFGAENTERMVALYGACEMVANPARNDLHVPALGEVFGNPDFNLMLRFALEGAKTIRLPRDYRPVFQVATPPADLLAYLKRNLALSYEMSKAGEAVIEAKKRAASRRELEAIVREGIRRSAPYRADLDYPRLVETLRKLAQPDETVSDAGRSGANG